MRRESLIDEADAREKRSVGNHGAVSNRIVFERKLENLSNRKKQAKMVIFIFFICTSAPDPSHSHSSDTHKISCCVLSQSCVSVSLILSANN